jgi:thymidylate synthase
MAWKTMVTELLWFLRGDTNIKYLVDNGCHIWDGDAYKNYDNIQSTRHAINKARNMVSMDGSKPLESTKPLSQEEFINRIKTDDEFAKLWGNLGPIYGKQWRTWDVYDQYRMRDAEGKRYYGKIEAIDQIANSINLLKTDPDSRRLLVSAWNPAELDQMVLPPCHYGFQVYTRELSLKERQELQTKIFNGLHYFPHSLDGEEGLHKEYDKNNVPRRAISLMWNQRSVDTFLGLPFNIASYGLLLEIVAKVVNMVPDELIGNLGDTHLYLNHIEQAKEQIGRELDLEERRAIVTQEMFNQIYTGGSPDTLSHSECDQWDIPRIIQREPYPLPTLRINTEFWPTESGECGIGNLTDNIDFLIKEMQINDFQIENYKSHSAIKAPLSN